MIFMSGHHLIRVSKKFRGMNFFRDVKIIEMRKQNKKKLQAINLLIRLKALKDILFRNYFAAKGVRRPGYVPPDFHPDKK